MSRRQILLTAFYGLLFPGGVAANINQTEKIDWPEFYKRMNKLANESNNKLVSQNEMEKLSLQYLKDLDISSTYFKQAIEQSYETGNQYWLWQRLVKTEYLNGGILNINKNKVVQLHDHPGATGILRILSGETEVWLFDETHNSVNKSENGKHTVTEDQSISELTLVSHRLLKAGDMAILTPDKGNIHALRATSNECRMLDFFIPPYNRSERNWYEPLTDNWFNQKSIRCKKIPQHAYNFA